MITKYQLLSINREEIIGDSVIEVSPAFYQKQIIREHLKVSNAVYDFLFHIKHKKLYEVQVQVKYKDRASSFLLHCLKKKNEWFFYKKKLGVTWMESGGEALPFSFFSITSLYLMNEFTTKTSQLVDMLRNTDYSAKRQGGVIHLAQSKRAPSSISFVDDPLDFWPTELKVVPIYNVKKIKTKTKQLPKILHSNLEFQEKITSKLSSKPLRVKTRDGVFLSGQFDGPQQKSKKTIIVLLHGSGPEDRDAGSGYEGRNYKRSKIDLFKSLSGHFAEQGFHTFRFDKRSCGLSQGNWSQTSLSQLVLDAEDVVYHLKLKYPDFKQIVMGFSEGANIALSVGKNLEKKIDGLILAGSPAEAIDQVILEKLAFKLAHVDKSEKKAFAERLNAWRDTFKKLKSIKLDVKTNHMFQSYPLNWWLEHLDHKPLSDAKAVNTPVLLIHGDMDSEVRPSQARKLYLVLRKNHPKNRLIIMQGLNHFFAKAHQPLGIEYDVPTGVTPQFVKKVTNWLNTTFML